MKKRLLKITVALVLVAALGGAGFHFWRRHVVEKLRADGLATAEQLIKANKPREALTALQTLYRQGGAPTGPAEDSARRLELAAAAALGDLPRLLDLQRRRPELVAENEKASLLVVRAMRAYRTPEAPAASDAEKKTADPAGEPLPSAEVPATGTLTPAAAESGIAAEVAAAEKLRESWRNRAAAPEAWLCLDADQLLAGGHRAEARQLLESTVFPGKADSGRLLRLAIMTAKKPEECVRWFEAAYRADPENPDLRSFRGQILENGGQFARARVEYIAALVAQPGNPLLRDQLTEFYLRRKNLPAALKTMSESLRENPLEFMRVKAEFWSRIAEPLKDRPVAASAGSAPGGAGALADFIAKVPEGRFWDAEAFLDLAGAKVHQTRQKEVFWLSLLERLRGGEDEAEALEMLESNPFRQRSPDAELEKALGQILRFRLSGERPLTAAAAPAEGGRHQLFETLGAWSKDKPNEALEAFLKGPHACAGACLAAGWTEAAITLTRTVDPAEKPETAPEWFRYGMAQALRRCRGEASALTFLRAQPTTELLTLLLGETALAAGHRYQALPLLKEGAARDSDAGFRAAWLLATDAAEHRDFAAARGFVAAQPRLADSVAGQECLARWALLEGKTAEAEALYGKISTQSAEAKMFLSRVAFSAKRWDEARRLTNELLEEMPDELALRRNLAAIEEAAAVQP